MQFSSMLLSSSVFLLVLASAAEAGNSQFLSSFSCDNTRYTGYNNHRTLHVPAAIWDDADTSQEAIAWANTLCCVYTWVMRDADATHPYMITYDGGRRTYSGVTTFSKATEVAYDAICAMYMGSRDCRSCTAPAGQCNLNNNL